VIFVEMVYWRTFFCISFTSPGVAGKTCWLAGRSGLVKIPEYSFANQILPLTNKRHFQRYGGKS
jgi:hypothetical protein